MGGEWVTGCCSCVAAMTTTRMLRLDLNIFSSLPNYFQWRRTFFYSSGCSNCKGCNTNKILINFKVRQSPWIKRWVHETMVSPKVETKLLIAITIRINIFLISPSIKKQSWGRQLHHWIAKWCPNMYSSHWMILCDVDNANDGCDRYHNTGISTTLTEVGS